MISDRRSVITGTLAGATAWLALGLWSTAAFAQAPPPGRGGGMAMDPRAQARTYHLAEAKQDLPYCVFVSSKVSKDKPAPLIVTLHGMGAQPSIMCNKTAVDLAEEGGYILVSPMGLNPTGWYGSPVINLGGGGRGRGPGAGAPGAPPGAGAGAGGGAPAAGSGLSNAEIERLSELDVMTVLDMMRKEFNVDPKRIYLTGHSMGGAGAYFLASKHPDLWAAVAPVAPASFMMNATRADVLKRIKDAGMPILILTGDADEVVSPQNTRDWVATARELGMNHEYVEQPGVTHGPVITTSQAPIYAFFAKHKKK